jgi:hypothetical protein
VGNRNLILQQKFGQGRLGINRQYHPDFIGQKKESDHHKKKAFSVCFGMKLKQDIVQQPNSV